MSALRRGLLIGGAILLTLLLAVAVTLGVLLRPAALKARIERAVLESTGLALRIDGEVSWQAWPTPRIAIGAARIVAGAARGAAPLAQWRVLSAAARWRPLLHGEAQLESLRLDGPALTLVRGADGAIRWPEMTSMSANGAAASSGPARVISIGRLAITHGGVRIVTESGTQLLALDGLAFQAGVDYDPAAATLRLARPAASAQLHGGTLQNEGLRLVLDAPALRLRVAPLALDAQRLHLRVDALDLALRPDGPLDLATPAGSGELTLALPSLRAFAAALGSALPPTRDAGVFGPLDVQASWRIDAGSARLDPLRLALDGAVYQGRVNLPAGGPAAGHPVRFELQGGRLDLRRYLRPQDQPGEPFTLPVEWLRAQHVEGVLELEEAHAVVGVLLDVKITVLDQPPGARAGQLPARAP